MTASSKTGFMVNENGTLKLDIISPVANETACNVAKNHLIKHYLAQKMPVHMETWKFTHHTGVVFYFGHCLFSETVKTSSTPTGEGTFQTHFLEVATYISPCLEAVIQELIVSGIYDVIDRPTTKYRKKIWDYSYPVENQCPNLTRQPVDSTETFNLHMEIV